MASTVKELLTEWGLDRLEQTFLDISIVGMDTDILYIRNQLLTSCYDGDEEGSQNALEELERSHGKKVTNDDFPPHLNPTIAACLGKNFDLAARFVDNGVTEINQNTASVAEVELPHLLNRWVEVQEDGNQKALWSKKHLYIFQASWLQFPEYKASLYDINLSSNHLIAIPEELLWGLPNLRTLDVSHNELQCLPGPLNEERLKSSALNELSVAHNELCGIPVEIFQLQNLNKLELQDNKIETLDPDYSKSRLNHHGPDERWSCPKLEELDLSNNRLEYLPSTAVEGATNLKLLRITNNNLRELPPSWKCPLETLMVKNNAITTLQNLDEHWALTLTKMDLSGNRLEEIPETVCQLIALDSLHLSNNQIRRLPPRGACKIFKLHNLDLAGNQLVYKDNSSSVTPKGRPSSFLRAISHSDKSSTPPSSPEVEIIQDDVFDFLNALRDSLQHLDLSHNLLEALPPCICKLHRLLSLDISGNEKLEKLPNELANLKHLLNLKEPKSLKEPEEVVKVIEQKERRKTDKILSLLYDRLYSSQPFYGMKMMVLGPARGGKTSLIGSLVGKHDWLEGNELVNVCEWRLTEPSEKSSFININKKKSVDESNKVIFTIWDLKGGDIYETIQPCLYTDKCLYLVVWDGSEGPSSVDNLKYYVADIQQKAPQSEIILVSTHADTIRSKNPSKESELQNRVKTTFHSQIPLFLVNTTSTKRSSNDGIFMLKSAIYNRAINAKMTTSNRLQQCIVGRKVPQAFLLLKAELDEKKRSVFQTRILTRARLQEKIHEYVKQDIDSEELLQHALDFLSASGIVLPVKIRGGRQLIILDPIWLCKFLFEVTQISTNELREQKCSFAILKRISEKYGVRNADDFLQLVEGLEVAIPVQTNRKWFWIPAKLPKDKPAANFSEDNIPCLRRYYQFPYTPPGFWVRLVSRLVISLKQLDDKDSSERRRSSYAKDDARSGEVPKFSAWNPHLARKSMEGIPLGLNLRLTSMFYWQEGVLAMHDTGRIQVEKYNFDNGKTGISIQIHCQTAEFKEIGFVVDHIENLIKDWYPGLVKDFQQPTKEDSDSSVKRIVPCPSCEDSDNLSSLIESGHHYFVEDLTIKATHGASDEIRCSTTDKPVRLKSVIPDIFLNDLEVDVYTKSQLPNVKLTADTRLGKGGFGEVFRAHHHEETIAVKTLASRRILENTNISLDPLDAFDVIDSFSKYRAEVAMMSRLRHPHIVRMKWACIQMVAFAMEFAPDGDLSTVLEKHFTEFKARHVGHTKIHDTVIDWRLTFKIVVQMVSAVAYLHSNELIYCDLKTDNALVFSLDLDDQVNIKLTDYGISRQLIGQGGYGDAGPPGFCAPEILKHDIFDKTADWFSFGMVLYHLLSGVWPYEDLERSERQSATIRGVRPDFNFCGYKLIPTLQSIQQLMEECWNDQPKERPGGKEIIKVLSDAGALCLRHVIPLQKVDSENADGVVGMFAYGSGGVNHSLHIWSRRNRSCVIYQHIDMTNEDRNIMEGPATATEIKNINNIVFAHVDGNLHFFQNTFLEISVFEETMCEGTSTPDFKFKEVITAKDPVESMCFKQTDEGSCRGYLIIGHKRSRIEVFGFGNQERNPSKLYTKIPLPNKLNAACCNMQLLRDGNELWFSCGNMIIVASFIVDDSGDDLGSVTIDILHVFPVVDPNATIYTMKYHMGYLWCNVAHSSIDSLSQVVKFDVSSQQCVGRMELKGKEAVGHNISTHPGNDRLGSELHVDDVDPECNSKAYVLCVQITKDFIWLGTANGEIIVVDITEKNFGRVLGLFSLGNADGIGKSSQMVRKDQLGPIRYLSLIGNDQLVACQEINEEVKGNSSGRQGMRTKYRLVVWDRWPLSRFLWFERAIQPLVG